MRRGAKFFWKLGVEVGEDVEFGYKSFTLVKMLGVFASPEEAFAGGAFEAGGINFAPAEDGLVLFRKVVAYDADKIHMSKEAGGYGEIGRGAADDAVDFAVRAFNGVECDGTYDEK
jgi:hypothetical protein